MKWGSSESWGVPYLSACEKLGLVPRCDLKALEVFKAVRERCLKLVLLLGEEWVGMRDGPERDKIEQHLETCLSG